MRGLGTPARLLVAFATVAVSLAPGTAQAQEPTHARCADAVVPVDWDRFDERVREDENTRLIKRVLLNANRYALTTWYHEKKPYADQPGPYLDFGGVGENAIRPPTSEAFALAVSLETGAYDAEEVGVGRSQARQVAAKLISSTAYRHKANSAGGWGDAWQSALWASMAGHAGWLLWDDLPSHDREYVRKMVEHEANRFLDYQVPYYRNANGDVVTPGDSKAEENAWNALILQLATAMMPRHGNWSTWMDKNLELMISAFARPDDQHSRRVVNGKRLSEWLNGSNVESEITGLELGDRFGVVINHNRIHPDYMTTAYNNASAAYTYTLAGMATPRAALFNVDIMYNSLVDLNFPHPPFNSPGGTTYKDGTWDIYYPQSNDWGSGRQLNFVAIDVLAHEYGFDHDATVGGDIWANRHASRAHEMQERHPDGRMYADDTEDRFFSKEEFVAFLAARSYLTSWVGDRKHARFTNRAYPIRPCAPRGDG